MGERLKTSGERLCVVMPVYNEQEAIGKVLEKWDAALKTIGVDYEIRPYNDGSKDGSLAVMRDTADRLRSRIAVMDKPNGGHGNTILTGYRKAAADGFDWIFQVDSDDEMGPERFRDLWERRSDFDFLVGIRDGRRQALPRKIISLVSRLCVRAFYGRGIWDVNSPYRLMRVSAFKDFFGQIPLTTFAPNVILSGLAARHGLRCFETRVPQHDRTTGEVSIKKWKLAKAAAKSLWQTVSFAMFTSDVAYDGADRSFWMKVGLWWMCAVAVFAWLPDTYINWGYDYLSFLPPYATAIVAGLAFLVLLAPFERRFSSLFRCPCVRAFCALAALCVIPALFWLCRTRIHCFSGDGCVGTVVADTTLRLADFIPPLPGAGRLDCWGMGPLGKLLTRYGFLQGFTGMSAHFISQIYSVLCGAVYVALVLFLFRRSIAAICAFLTLPYVFNFFGNIDCYTFSLCMAVIFFALAASCDSRGESVSVLRGCVLCALWLLGMWTHPFFVFGGFLVIPIMVRCFNRLQKRVKFNEMLMQMLFAAALFAAILSSQHAKAFFAWPYGERPPVFSWDTVIHLLNVVLLPSAPIALVVWHGRSDRVEKLTISAVFALMGICFLPLGFTQGVNDQFPYMHLAFFFALPWILMIMRHAPSPSALRFLLAANLFLLVPMIAVHSTDRTVARAEALYPKDPCKHNREMSWQTHLGLILGDNIIDSSAVKAATLRTFANGARHAEPAKFRGGNYIYHTAFLYHFGEFEQGRRQLFSLLKQNPEVIRWFLNVRPGFIYCNRKRLWDDIDLFLVQQKSPMLGEYRKVAEKLRQNAAAEPFCIKQPTFAVSEY